MTGESRLRSSWPVRYLVAAVLFLALDGLWLGVLARDLYDRELGALAAREPNLVAAAIFYAFFLVGLLYFVIRPAAAADSVRLALGVGAFFGAVTYATFDLTSLAVIEGFPAGVVAIDIAWGALLCALVSAGTLLLTRPARRNGRG